MSQTIEIGNIRAGKGAKKAGILKVGEKPLFSLDLPVTVVNGSKPGSTLCLTAGVHGCEYAGIEATIRIAKKIDPKELNGALLIVHVINVPAFQTRTPLVCPIDNVNINRAYPGKLDGSISHTIAYKIFNEVVKKSDYLIDLHGGDMGEAVFPFVIFERTGNEEVDKTSESLARAYGLEYVVDGWVGPSSLFYEAAKQGIPGILAEAGGEGKIEERDVNLHYNGIINVMKHLKMLEGIPSQSVVPKTVRPSRWLHAKRGGIFYPSVQVGSIISKGDVIGEIRNIKGETLETITSPMTGVILCMITNPIVNTGDFLLIICGTEKK